MDHTFTVFLPATPSNNANEARGTDNDEDIGEAHRALHVLLMDDEAMVRTTAAKMLQKLGHTVETAEHGDEALSKYAGASGDHNPIHIDIDFARKYGMDDVISHGMLIMAYLGRMLTNWVPQTALRSYKVRFASMTRVHSIITCSGRVAEKLDGNQVRVEIQAADQDGDVKLVGEAVIRLT